MRFSSPHYLVDGEAVPEIDEAASLLASTLSGLGSAGAVDAALRGLCAAALSGPLGAFPRTLLPGDARAAGFGREVARLPRDPSWDALEKAVDGYGSFAYGLLEDAPGLDAPLRILAASSTASQVLLNVGQFLSCAISQARESRKAVGSSPSALPAHAVAVSCVACSVLSARRTLHALGHVGAAASTRLALLDLLREAVAAARGGGGG